MSYVIGRLLLSAQERIELAIEHQYDWKEDYVREALIDALALVKKAERLNSCRETYTNLLKPIQNG